MVTNNPTNSNSAGALSFGILSILIPIIGLVFGILGIVFSNKAKKEIMLSSESGMGLASAGLICSIVGLTMQAFILLSLVLYTTTTTSIV